jgi:hypothetical protein
MCNFSRSEEVTISLIKNSYYHRTKQGAQCLLINQASQKAKNNNCQQLMPVQWKSLNETTLGQTKSDILISQF